MPKPPKKREPSTRRTLVTAGFVDVDATTACRWCGGPLAGRRRTFCSHECVHEHKIRSNPGYAREQVFRRDRGVCELCSIDTQRLTRLLVQHGRKTQERIFALLKRAVPPPSRSTYWDNDHRTPVVEGGGECGLENMRTLCWWCHKGETKKLARRRARARSPQTHLFEAVVLDADIGGE